MEIYKSVLEVLSISCVRRGRPVVIDSMCKAKAVSYEVFMHIRSCFFFLKGVKKWGGHGTGPA